MNLILEKIPNLNLEGNFFRAYFEFYYRRRQKSWVVENYLLLDNGKIIKNLTESLEQIWRALFAFHQIAVTDIKLYFIFCEQNALFLKSDLKRLAYDQIWANNYQKFYTTKEQLVADYLQIFKPVLESEEYFNLDDFCRTF